MKHLLRRAAALALAAAMTLTLTGCIFRSSVEDLFTLPRVAAEYAGLSQELDDLQKQGYELIAPSAGENIQSVQMVDLNNDGQSEALVFMRLQGDEKPLKIFIFRPEDESYHQLCVIESSGTAIDSVQYEDLTGNGHQEIIVGWRISADVQTVAVYVPQPEPYVLLQSGYTRFTVTDLDGDGVKSLLLFRSDNDGQPVAGLYVRKDDVISASYSSVLSCTMAELSRGSIVCGKLDSQSNAAFITGVDEGNQAMTDILVSREGELKNVTQSRSTGKTDVHYAFSQLRPQDINNDGIIEIPYPADSTVRSAARVFCWYRYNDRGDSVWVMDTYHNQPDGWYLTLSEDWHGCMKGTDIISTDKGSCVTLQCNGEAMLYLYSFSGEDRDREARSDGRTLLMLRSNMAYAMRITEAGEHIGVSNEWVNSHFYLISTAWAAGN